MAKKRSLDEPVAWLHTMWQELGQKQVEVTRWAISPFGVPGIDHSKSYPVTSEPLYRRSFIKRPRVRV